MILRAGRTRPLKKVLEEQLMSKYCERLFIISHTLLWHSTFEFFPKLFLNTLRLSLKKRQL